MAKDIDFNPKWINTPVEAEQIKFGERLAVYQLRDAVSWGVKNNKTPQRFVLIVDGVEIPALYVATYRDSRYFERYAFLIFHEGKVKMGVVEFYPYNQVDKGELCRVPNFIDHKTMCYWEDHMAEREIEDKPVAPCRIIKRG